MASGVKLRSGSSPSIALFSLFVRLHCFNGKSHQHGRGDAEASGGGTSTWEWPEGLWRGSDNEVLVRHSRFACDYL